MDKSHDFRSAPCTYLVPIRAIPGNGENKTVVGMIAFT